MIINLKGSNKKLLHKAGMHYRKANLYAKNNNIELFKFYNKEADRIIEMLARKIKIGKTIKFIAPCNNWNSIKVFSINKIL